jgi:hypothetical protein
MYDYVHFARTCHERGKIGRGYSFRHCGVSTATRMRRSLGFVRGPFGFCCELCKGEACRGKMPAAAMVNKTSLTAWKGGAHAVEHMRITGRGSISPSKAWRCDGGRVAAHHTTW